MQEYKFLILGHPRCGTAFMSSVFQNLGYDVKHERIGNDGTSNWVYTIPDDHCFLWITRNRNNFEFKHIIHCVRDPITALASIAFTETAHTWKYFNVMSIFQYQSTKFRKKYIKFDENMPLFEQAIRSFIGWNKLIEDQNPDVVVRVEHVKEDLEKFSAISLPDDFDVPTPKNCRKHPDIKKEDLENVPDSLLNEVEQFCVKYGYESFKKRIIS